MNAQTTRKSLLLVDDIPANLKSLVAVLRADYELLIAKSGVQAIALAQSGTVDLILLDVVMPEMDGYAVCKQLKGLPETAHIPIIFLTAKSEGVDVAMGLALGAVDFLTKPVDPLLVQARVRGHLGLQSGWCDADR